MGDGYSSQIHPNFPDPETCRVRPNGFGNYYDCLSPWAFVCPAAHYFGGHPLCRHVKVREIKKWKVLPPAKPKDQIPPRKI